MEQHFQFHLGFVGVDQSRCGEQFFEIDGIIFEITKISVLRNHLWVPGIRLGFVSYIGNTRLWILRERLSKVWNGKKRKGREHISSSDHQGVSCKIPVNNN